jgi:hypothetical protein
MKVGIISHGFYTNLETKEGYGSRLIPIHPYMNITDVKSMIDNYRLFCRSNTSIVEELFDPMFLAVIASISNRPEVVDAIRSDAGEGRDYCVHVKVRFCL